MSIIEFRDLIIDRITGVLEDTKVTKCDALKNNGVYLYGICLNNKNSNVYPTIYLERYYQRYLSDEPIENIVTDILEYDEENRFSGEFDVDLFFDFERLRDRLFVKLISREKNKDFLKSVPSRDFLDLSIVVYCDVSDMCGQRASITIKKEHVSKWNVTEDELIDIAMDNTRGSKPKITDMSYYIDKVTGETRDDSRGKMYVMTNDALIFGAVSMLSDDLLDEFLQNKARGVYILPSSICEVILVIDNGEYDNYAFDEIINQVNIETLSEEEILSTHAYYYSAENGYSIV